MAINRTYLPICLAVAVLATPALFAQKIAYVSSEAIMDKFTDAKNARAKLTEIQLGWMREIGRQEADVAKLQGEIETNRLLWSAQEKRDAESKLADQQAKLTAFRMAKFGPKQEFEKQQAELLGPVMDKISKAIEDEARAQKFDYVFDKSSRGMPMLYGNPANDITWAVLKRLGVEPDVTAPKDGTGARTEADPKTEQDARKNRGGRREIISPTDPKPLTDPNQILKPDPDGSGGTGTTDGNPK